MSKKPKKIDDGIYILEKKKQNELSSSKKIIFTILGNHKSLDDGYPILSNTDDNTDLAFAKREIINNIENYYVKVDDENMLYNPISAASKNRDHKSKVLKNQENSWQFTKVNKACFQQYIEFLKTRNPLYLKYSERIR